MTADSNHGFKMIGVGKLVAKLLTSGDMPAELTPFALRRYREGLDLRGSKFELPLGVTTYRTRLRQNRQGQKTQRMKSKLAD